MPSARPPHAVIPSKDGTQRDPNGRRLSSLGPVWSLRLGRPEAEPGRRGDEFEARQVTIAGSTTPPPQDGMTLASRNSWNMRRNISSLRTASWKPAWRIFRVSVITSQSVPKT